MGLKVHPELGTVTEVQAEAQSGICCNAPTIVDDLGDPVWRNSNCLGQLILRKAVLRQETFRQGSLGRIIHSHHHLQSVSAGAAGRTGGMRRPPCATRRNWDRSERRQTNSGHCSSAHPAPNGNHHRQTRWRRLEQKRVPSSMASSFRSFLFMTIYAMPIRIRNNDKDARSRKHYPNKSTGLFEEPTTTGSGNMTSNFSRRHVVRRQ